MKQHIYADNAATTKLDNGAFEAMIPWLTEEYGNASQPYAWARKPRKALADARETIAACINAEPEQIYFTSGGTESDNWAIKCFGAAPSDYKVIATSAIEHHAVLNACKNQANANVTHLPVDQFGIVNGKDIAAALDYSNRPICTCMVKLVSIMMANNEIGTIMPVKEYATIAHKYGACFHTDAVQAMGHIPIDVKEFGIDMLSASAHKFNGPKGIGFFYDSGKHVYPHNDGGAQENRMRAGTENVAAIVGMAEALRTNCENMEKNAAYVRGLENQLIDRLNVAGVSYHRNGGENRLPGLISLSFAGKDGEAILHRMDLMGISISTGSACDSVNTEISHVLKAIRLDENLAKGTIRISLGKNNTVDDVEKIAQALIRILSD